MTSGLRTIYLSCWSFLMIWPKGTLPMLMGALQFGQSDYFDVCNKIRGNLGVIWPTGVSDGCPKVSLWVCAFRWKCTKHEFVWTIKVMLTFQEELDPGEKLKLALSVPTHPLPKTFTIVSVHLSVSTRPGIHRLFNSAIMLYKMHNVWWPRNF